MDRVPKDVLIDLALELSLPDLLNLCRSSSTSFICYSDVFWTKKLKKDYGIIGVSNPKEAYKNIPTFKKHCKNLINTNVVNGYSFVLEMIDSDYFNNVNNYVVFKFLLNKILSKGIGLANYYIIEYNKISTTNIYKSMISTDPELSYDEYMLFKKLLNDIRNSEKSNSFEKAYIDGMIRGDIPIFTNWKELCQYDIY